MRPRLEPWRLSDVLIVVTVVAALMIVSFLGGRAFCAAVLAALIVGPVHAGALDETRYCGEPKRNARGDIIRRADVLAAFEKANPRPADGRKWFRDHAVPLACCGCDSVGNLTWMHEKAWRDKSTWERKVYGGRGCSPGCP